jgi:hypothetical protein
VEGGRGFFRVESGVIDPGAVDARIMVLTVSFNPISLDMKAYIPFSASLAFRSMQIDTSFSSLTQIRAHWDPSGEGKRAAPCTNTGSQLSILTGIRSTQLTSVGEESDKLLRGD